MRRMGSEARVRACRPALLLACLAGVAAAAGCGSTGTVTGTNADVKQPDATVKLAMDEYRLKPATARASRAGLISIEASNAGRQYHALRVVVPGKASPTGSPAELAAEEEIGEINPGDTETLNITLKPGTYKWYCPLSNHRRLGMRGKLVVR
jgi:uncharacterized cupredoxin-like copper-binding protein